MLTKNFFTSTLVVLVSGAALFFQFNFCPNAAQAAMLDKPMVTLSFDDGYKSLNTYALPMLKKYNFPATCYIPTDFVGQDNRVSWNQIKSFSRSYGWEIGNHTKSHANLTEITDQEVLSQIADAKNIFKNQGINNVTALAPPYGEFNDHVINILKEQGYITSNREAWTEETAFNELGSFNQWSLNVSSLESDKMNYAKAKSLIDQAVSGKKWLIFVVHDIVKAPSNPYQFKSTELQKIVDYLGTLSKNNKLRVVTISAGVSKMNSYKK